MIYSLKVFDLQLPVAGTATEITEAACIIPASSKCGNLAAVSI